jgi:hypothetical protein
LQTSLLNLFQRLKKHTLATKKLSVRIFFSYAQDRQFDVARPDRLKKYQLPIQHQSNVVGYGQPLE